MMRTDIVDDTIRVAQQKTAAKLSIPIHEALARLLAIANRNHETILVTAYGNPFSVKGFGNMMSNAIRDAGLPRRCVPHGLRKAAARAAAGGPARHRGDRPKLVTPITLSTRILARLLDICWTQTKRYQLSN
jgi:hypothetical protein